MITETVAAMDVSPITTALSDVGPAAAVVLGAAIAVGAVMTFGLKLWRLAKSATTH